MAKNISLVLLGCIFLSIECWTGFARASDYKSMKSPIFDGVKQVYVHVHYSVGLSEEEQAMLPKPLQKKNIEALLMTLYTERFSSKDCGKHLQGKTPYSCNDQPVTLLSSDEEYGKYEAREAMKEPGTLNILFQVKYMKSDDFPQPQVALYLIQDRSDPGFPTQWEISFPFSLPTSLADETAYKWLVKYIDDRIQ